MTLRRRSASERWRARGREGGSWLSAGASMVLVLVLGKPLQSSVICSALWKQQESQAQDSARQHWVSASPGTPSVPTCTQYIIKEPYKEAGLGHMASFTSSCSHYNPSPESKMASLMFPLVRNATRRHKSRECISTKVRNEADSLLKLRFLLTPRHRAF